MEYCINEGVHTQQILIAEVCVVLCLLHQLHQKFGIGHRHSGFGMEQHRKLFAMDYWLQVISLSQVLKEVDRHFTRHIGVVLFLEIQSGNGLGKSHTAVHIGGNDRNHALPPA